MQTVETISAGTTMETARRRSAWLVVAVSSIGLFLHLGSLLVNAFGVVLTTLCDQFQWSRGQVSYAFSLATLTAMLSMPLVPMLKDRGMTPASATLTASLFGLAGMIGRLGMGYLLDLAPTERVPTIAFSVVAAGIFLLFAGATGGKAYFAAMLIGFGYGAESATIPYLVGRYFGLRSFGEIYSYLFLTSSPPKPNGYRWRFLR